MGREDTVIFLCSPFSKALLQKEPELLGLALSIKLLVYRLLSMCRCLKQKPV